MFSLAFPFVGRTTRLGREFSPWSWGPPVRSHLPYSIKRAVEVAAQERQTREDAGYESVDERDVETPTPPSSIPNSPSKSYASLPESGAPEPDAFTSPPSPPLSGSPKPPCTAPGKSSRLRHRRTAHVKSGNKKRQQRKRDAKQAQASAIKTVALRHRRNSNPVMPSYGYNVGTDAPVTKPGWVARNLSYEKELLDLETLTGPEYNMVLVPWDGVWVLFI